MGDNHGAAGEIKERVFQRAQSFHVQIVGRFVKKDQVSALLESQRKVQTVAFTAGKNAGLLLLIGTLEAERRNVGARRHFNVANLDVIEAVRDYFPKSLFRIDTATVLINVGELHGFTDLQAAFV